MFLRTDEVWNENGGGFFDVIFLKFCCILQGSRTLESPFRPISNAITLASKTVSSIKNKSMDFSEIHEGKCRRLWQSEPDSIKSNLHVPRG